MFTRQFRRVTERQKKLLRQIDCMYDIKPKDDNNHEVIAEAPMRYSNDMSDLCKKTAFTVTCEIELQNSAGNIPVAYLSIFHSEIIKKMRGQLINKIISILLLLFIASGCVKIKNLEKPNILFIFTDDQKYNTIGALGNSHILTPNLDKLAEDAFVFNNAYCFGGNASAVCVPSRNMLMSGKTFFRFEADTSAFRRIKQKASKACYTNPAWPTIPKSMQRAGYETYFREKSGSANNPEVREQFEHKGDINMIDALSTGRPGKGIVDQALQFLKTGRDNNRSFFMYLGFPCPHDPRWSLKEFRDLYNPEELPLPENYKPVYNWDIGDMTVRDERLEAWPRTKESVRRHLYDYYSVIRSMDYDIGRLLEGIKSMGLDENTIIVFSSDQGIAIGDHGLMGKQNIYEGSMKVPFFITGPGIEKGSTDALVYLHDIFPTLCEILNTEIPEGLDGISLQGIINGKQEGVRENLMLAYKNFQRSVRDDRYKLIRFPLIDRTLLFDLSNDPHEIKNLAYDSEYASVVKRMIGKLEIERKALGDKIDLFPGNYSPAEFIAPEEKLPTRYPAGGLAPGESLYNK